VRAATRHDDKGEQQTVVKIRFQKLGRRNRAYFRIIVVDARRKRQGTYLEKIGQYDPVETDKVKRLSVDTERLKHWIGLGAQPTEALEVILADSGVLVSSLRKPKVKKEKKKPAAAAKK
jgi:small subunit ribosomal protein S16